ncbi:MAG: polyphosphate polymerase domain-containing protein [Lachnospiraceae bacterium]|nr:polyphosphate polymerase domain-containing protein [Lachnospiraceae bacterium]
MDKTVFKRIETKYLLNDIQYMALCERIRHMARVDEYGESTILNIYFDTSDFRLIRTSLDKPHYKEKLRLRSYGIPSDETKSFIEIKKKYDGVVYKRRITAPYATSLDYLYNGQPLKERSQISKEIDYFINYYQGLQPAMAISYDRIAMIGTTDPELRITFDTNIRWRCDHLDLKYGNVGQDILLPGQHLMEIKIAGAMSTELASILSELHIYPISFSKYGRGYQMMVEQRQHMIPYSQKIRTA